MYSYVCNTFTPHIKASSHATYIMLHSLGVLQLPRCGTYNFQWNVVQLPNGMWYNFQILLLYTLTHNALSHSGNWLHTYTKYFIKLSLHNHNALAICINNLTNNCDKYLWYSTYQYCYYGNESVT